MLMRGLVGINCSSKCKNDADFTNGNHTWYQQKKKRKTSKLFLPIHLFVFCKNNCKDRTTYHHLFSPVQPSHPSVFSLPVVTNCATFVEACCPITSDYMNIVFRITLAIELSWLLVESSSIVEE
jgi:hypothetical protein